jgi:hypothetical protein
VDGNNSTVMKKMRLLILGSMCACLGAGVVGASAARASAATIGPIDVAVTTPVVPPSTESGVQLDLSGGLAVAGAPQVGVGTSVGVTPTGGVDAKIAVSADGQAAQAGVAVPSNGAPPTVDVSLPPLAPGQLAEPGSLGTTPAASAGASDPSARAVDGRGAASTASTASAGSTATNPRLDGRPASPTALRHGPVDAAIQPSDVSASIEAPRRGMWSSLGRSAAKFGPWLLLLALAGVVELVAKGALREQRARGRALSRVAP